MIFQSWGHFPSLQTKTPTLFFWEHISCGVGLWEKGTSPPPGESYSCSISLLPHMPRCARTRWAEPRQNAWVVNFAN